MKIVAKQYPLISVFLLAAVIIAVPKDIGLFRGMVVTYIGLCFLVLYPFLYRFGAARPVHYLFSLGFLGCTGYGWATVITYSNSFSFGVWAFFGALLIIISISGFLVAILTMVRYSGYDGIVTNTFHSDGIFTLVRHPHTLSWILFMFGLILFFKSFALALSAPLWIIGFVAYAAMEEKFELVPRYGDNYLNYCSDTPGLIPNNRSTSRFLKYISIGHDSA